MERKIKQMFGRRILIKLDTTREELANKIKIKREVAAGRELVSGKVLAVPALHSHQLEVGDIVVFPAFSMNEAGRLGVDMVTVDLNDLEWSEADGS